MLDPVGPPREYTEYSDLPFCCCCSPSMPLLALLPPLPPSPPRGSSCSRLDDGYARPLLTLAVGRFSCCGCCCLWVPAGLANRRSVCASEPPVVVPVNTNVYTCAHRERATDWGSIFFRTGVRVLYTCTGTYYFGFCCP